MFPYGKNESFTNRNLSKLVELSLGKKLNKTDQFSNWEKRPLRESQITYAALDAYCLLEVYDALAKQCDRLNISFYDICANVHNFESFTDRKDQESSWSELENLPKQVRFFIFIDIYFIFKFFIFQLFFYSPTDSRISLGSRDSKFSLEWNQKITQNGNIFIIIKNFNKHSIY